MKTTYLLQTDRQQSVLSGSRCLTRRYTVYGAVPAALGPVQGFAGERRDQVTGWYHLGNGHRVYNPVLMRFHSSDRLSPFGKGGINAYAYCLGDPANHRDPTGRIAEEVYTALLVGANIVGALISFLRIGVGQGYSWRNLFSRAPRVRINSILPNAPHLKPPGFSLLDRAVSGVGLLSGVGGTVVSAATLIKPNGDPEAITGAALTALTLMTSFLEVISLVRMKPFNPNSPVTGVTYVSGQPNGTMMTEVLRQRTNSTTSSDIGETRL